jgi:hypothetical protein
MVIFIISAEETIRIADPRSRSRVGNAVLHYKPAGGTIPLPINVIFVVFLGEDMDVYFATASPTISPTAPHCTMTGKRVHPSSVIRA